VRWVRLDDAPRQLTYGHDAGVISGFRSLVSA
jgi:hypothetical protein